MSALHQESVCARFGTNCVPPQPGDKLGIALATLGNAPLNALRHKPEHGTSGWYVWGGELLSSDPDFFQPVHHSHVAEYCPALVPFFGLGPGWRVLLSSTQEDVWFDGSLLNAQS
jgi:hypothetical protein